MLDGDTVADVGIGLTAVGAPHFCAPDAEAASWRQGADRRDPRRARRGWPPTGCNPQADQRGPADYKRHLADELTLRALHRLGGPSAPAGEGA